MKHSDLLGNPFALMMDPAEVLRAMEQSKPLADLPSKRCSPLARLADDYTVDTGEDFGDPDIDDFGADLGLDFGADFDDGY